MLKDHREHRTAFGETEAQPSKGMHAAHRDFSPSLSPCQDTRAVDELLGHWDISVLQLHTPSSGHPRDRASTGHPRQGMPLSRQVRGAGMLAQLWSSGRSARGWLPARGWRWQAQSQCPLCSRGSRAGGRDTFWLQRGPRPPRSSRAGPAGLGTCHSCRISTGLDSIPTAAELGWGQRHEGEWGEMVARKDMVGLG